MTSSRPPRLDTTPPAAQSRGKRRQNALALTIALVLLLIGVTAFVGYDRLVTSRKDYTGNGDGTIALVKVEEGDTISSLAPELVSDDIVGSRRALMSAAEDKGGTVNLQQGYYVLQHHMSATSAIDALMSKDNRRGVVDIPNGTTLKDVHVVDGQTRPGIFSLVAQQACVKDKSSCTSAQQLMDAAGNSSLDDLGVPDWAKDAVKARGNDPRRLEGLISPGIHIFDPSASATDIMKTLVSQGVETYEGTGLESASKAIGLSQYQVLVAASLVERESLDNDFPKVARVIINRLNKPMKLEFDSTVNYGLDEQEVATTDADRQQKTPWNTYASDGLPATPIASPSLSAVHAMENPAPGDWLYFVTVDKNGTTIFTSNFADHEKAIKQAQASGVLDSSR